MPPKVESCVESFMQKDSNKSKWPDEKKRRSVAFAICNNAIQNAEARDYIVDLAEILFTDGDKPTWVHLLNYGTFEHPVFGEIDMTKKKVANFVKNFRSNVRGIMLDIDYSHKNDNSKGSKAAGWIVALEQRADGLWGSVSWTGEARKEIKDGAWKYMSVEYWDNWCNAKGACFDDVLFGAALTNRPFMKGLSPINFAELDDNGPFEQPEGKYSQEDAHYRMAIDSMYRCANCAFYQPGSETCMVVEGDIGADMTSDYFKPMSADLFPHAMDEDDPFYVDPVELGIKQFRDIPMSARKKMPSGDFAGKGTSFPIQKCEDVRAAFHALGLTKQNRDQIRSRIISIAKRKGFTSCLPASVKAEEFMDDLTARRILNTVGR